MIAIRSTMKATASVAMPKNAPPRPADEKKSRPSSQAKMAASATATSRPTHIDCNCGSIGSFPSVTTLIA